MQDLNGKTVVVTGAAGGLGQEFGKQLIQLGANLILTDYDETALRAFADRVAAKKSATGKVLAAIPADLATPEGCARLHARAVGAEPGIDLLINNAGILHYGLFHEIPPERWELQMEVNLLSPIRLTSLFLPAMLERGSGRIAFVCSVAGFIGTALGVTYAASKFGMRGFALGLAAEVEPRGVGVSIVYPYFTDTPMLKTPAFGDAEVVEGRALFRGNPRSVVRRSLRGIRKGRRHIYPDLVSWLAWQGHKLWPFTGTQAR